MVAPVVDLVLVHGAGSFGHFQAHEYGLSAGNKHPAAHIGIAECRRSVCALNQSLVASLVAAGLPAVSVSPFPTWRTRGRRLVSHGADSIRELMRAGLVPVLHGDVVLDGAQGCAILSGDTIVQTLCAHLRPRRGVFVTDVDGVYTSPPGSEGASLIGCIRVPPSGHCPEALRVRSSTAAHDSTGGLDTKLAAAVAIVASEAVRALAEEDKGEEPHSFSVGGVLDFAVSVVGISALERACQAGPLAKLLGVTGTHFVPQLSSGRDDD